MQEILHCFARILEFFGCPFREVVHAAMNVGIVAFVIADDRIDHCPGLLRGGGIVQINQRTPVDFCCRIGKSARIRSMSKSATSACGDQCWVLGQSSERRHLTSSQLPLGLLPLSWALHGGVGHR